MSRTICIPSLALNYEDNLLESVGIGGELYYRKQRDWHAITRSHEQTIERMGAENAKLRALAGDMHKALFSLNLDHCQACPREDACVFMHKSFDCDECAFERDMRELGVEVDG